MKKTVHPQKTEIGGEKALWPVAQNEHMKYPKKLAQRIAGVHPGQIAEYPGIFPPANIDAGYPASVFTGRNSPKNDDRRAAVAKAAAKQSVTAGTEYIIRLSALSVFL